MIPLILIIAALTGLIFQKMQDTNMSFSAAIDSISAEEITSTESANTKPDETEEKEEKPVEVLDPVDEEIEIKYPLVYDGTTSINIKAPELLVIGAGKDKIELKWVDYDQKITWTGAPNEEFPVDQYLVEFASS